MKVPTARLREEPRQLIAEQSLTWSQVTKMLLIAFSAAEEPIMYGKSTVDAELNRSLGLTMKTIAPLLCAGGDAAERKFMECCWCLWKANGAELVEPFVDTVFDRLPPKSRAVLFQRMLTIVYVAQENEIKRTMEPASS